jgi:hypothetical protein
MQHICCRGQQPFAQTALRENAMVPPNTARRTSGHREPQRSIEYRPRRIAPSAPDQQQNIACEQSRQAPFEPSPTARSAVSTQPAFEVPRVGRE